MVDVSGTKLLILDLDNTLCDTFHTLSRAQWEKVAQWLETRGLRHEAARLRASFGKGGFAVTIKALGLSKRLQEEAVRVYGRVDLGVLRLYPDAEAILRTDVPKVLVSRGERGLQYRKIRHLGIRDRLEKVYVVPTFKTKGSAFRRILKDYRLRPADALVVGDRAAEEITEGRRLGIPTCLVLRKDWPPGPGVPDVRVRSLASLAKRLKRR